MALLATELLAAGGRFGSERHTVINFDVLADLAGFADDRAGAMIDKKVGANPRAGMQIHPRAAMGPFGHDPWNERDVFQIKLMGQPLDCDRLHERIGDDNFFLAEGGGIAVVSRFGIGAQDLANAWQAAEEFQGQLAGGRAQLLPGQTLGGRILEALGNFIFKPAQHRIHQRNHFDLQLGGVDRLLIEKAGEKQPREVNRNRSDGRFGRQILSVQMVDAPNFGIGNDELIG